MINLTKDQEEIFRGFLRLTLEGVEGDVAALLKHLGADFSEIMELSSQAGDVEFSVDSLPGLKPGDRTLYALGVASRLSKKMLVELDEGVETEVIVVGAMCCESLIKKAAGWCLGVELTGAKAVKELLKLRNTLNAKNPRPNARAIERDDVLSEFHRLVREGHTEREARGILVQRGNMGSQTTIYRITKKK